MTARALTVVGIVVTALALSVPFSVTVRWHQPVFRQYGRFGLGLVATNRMRTLTRHHQCFGLDRYLGPQREVTQCRPGDTRRLEWAGLGLALLGFGLVIRAAEGVTSSTRSGQESHSAASPKPKR